MTQKAITSRVVVPEVLAVAFGIMILVGIVYFKHKYPVSIDRIEASHFVTAGQKSAELPNADGRLWRVHVLLR